MKVISSVKNELARDFLRPHLSLAVQYDRISGYFCSSVFQCADEAFAHFQGEGSIRMVCNSKVQWDDIQVARQALADEWKRQDSLIARERATYAKSQLAIDWSSNNPRQLVADDCPQKIENMSRFERLYDLLSSKKLIVRVIPKNIALPSGRELSLLHGKAGILYKNDDNTTVFYTSANDSANAWFDNYEILCEAESEQEKEVAKDDFEFFWNHPAAIDLADCEFIMRDIHGLSKNKKLTLEDWLDNPDPISPFVMSSINLKENGFMLHQNLFISQVFEEHQTPGGSRLVLADDVGLGKTLSLAGAAKLCFLLDKCKKPVLIVCPPNLMQQWQSELYNKLDLRSCYWNNNRWVLENEPLVPHPLIPGKFVRAQFGNMPNKIEHPPRQFIIVSSALFIQDKSCKEKVAALLKREYSCIILDEGHKARRENSGAAKLSKKPKYGFLYQNLLPFAEKTHSFLIGTATPVQLHPIELADLLMLISWRKKEVLGTEYSMWRNPNSIERGLALSVDEPNYMVPSDVWNWIRDPLPPASEGHVFTQLRNKIGVSSFVFHVRKSLDEINAPANHIVRSKICNSDFRFFTMHNPYIRHVVRRTREALETNYSESGVPILSRIEVKTVAGSVADFYLRNAYNVLSELVVETRNRNSGHKKFMPSLVAENLLRRVSSSQQAGLNSLRSLVLKHCGLDSEDEEDLFEDYRLSDGDFSEREIRLLKEAHTLMETAMSSFSIDPKSDIMFNLLKLGADMNGERTKPWMDLGCILFSQYYDTAEFFARNAFKYLPTDPMVGLYAGGNQSATYQHGIATPRTKEDLIRLINTGEIKILFATDAACEGLNLQMLSTLINIDLPWNPTKLSQRVGRIRRTKQKEHTVYVCNMRYRGTVEDRVYGKLCQRFAQIYDFFGTKPDYFEENDIWLKAVDPNREDELNRELGEFSTEIKNPFKLRYDDVFRSELKSQGDYDWANRDNYLLLDDELFSR